MLHTIYQYGIDGFFTGNIKEQNVTAPIPKQWTYKKPTGNIDERFVGNVWQILPTPPPPVPSSVTKRQAKEALIRQGTYQQALDSLASIVDPVEKQIAENYWSESQVFERDNPILNSMATDGLGMTQAELDDLFLYAVTL